MLTEDDNIKAIKWSCELFGIDLIPQSKDQKKLLDELEIYLDDLIKSDFNKLIAILYRIDISQAKATAALAKNEMKESQGMTLAKLIIERQLEKIEFRKLYSK